MGADRRQDTTPSSAKSVGEAEAVSGHVMITGASTGIGRATALELDRRGFHVYAGVRRRRDEKSLRKVGSERLQPMYLDLLNPSSIEAAAKDVESVLAGANLLGLVNNAGITVVGPLEFADLDELRRQFEVNAVGPIAVTQAFLPLLRRARGRIVNIGSIGGRLAAPMMGPYAASKFALEAFSDSLRVELQQWGIHVALIEPGAIKTPIFRKGQNYVGKLLDDYPPFARELYRPGIEAMQAAYLEMERTALPAKEVAKVVHHALTAKRPRTRYVVGLDAKIQGLIARFAPDRLKDWLLIRLVHYPTNREERQR